MHNISKSFFGASVLEGVDFSIEPEEIHALLGENGAGKTTLMNILYGLYKKDCGEIWIDGEVVDIQSPKDALEYGIGMVHQHFQLVDTLTVSENISLGLREKGYPFSNRRQINNRILKLSQRYGLEVDPNKKIKGLSVGERQRVEIMKLLYRSVRVLILDEPTAVLSPPEIDSFFGVLNQLRKAGHGIVIITHKIHEVQTISDRVTVLRDGKCVLHSGIGDASEAILSQAMIGRIVTRRQHKMRAKNEIEPRLILRELTVKCDRLDILNRFSLDLKPGEIVGVAGVDGNGQQELAEAVVGILPLCAGSVIFSGEDITNQDVIQRMEKGMGYIPADRHHDAILLSMNLKQNLLLKKHLDKDYLKYRFIDQKKTMHSTRDLIAKFQIKTTSENMPIRYLSGGNQQKFVLARELITATALSLLVAFQPTRGLDMGATDYIQNLLLDLSRKGTSILLISTDLQEILSLSDRIAVLYKGECMGVLPNDKQVDIQKIGSMMGGQKHAAD